MVLRDLQDKHKGQAGFVVGSAPSLHFQDRSVLNDYVVFAVNAGILACPECDYFVSDDEGAIDWNYYKDMARNSRCIKLLYETKLSKHVDHFRKEDVVFFKHKTWYDPNKKIYPDGGLIMTKDAEAPIIGARTSLATAVHLAYIAGCDPIVMLGADCCYRDNKRYFWQFPGEPKAFRVKGGHVFSTPNRGRKDGKPVDHHCVDFIGYWKQFADINAETANIVYASEGGILNVFPILTLKEVITQYGDRKKVTA